MRDTGARQRLVGGRNHKWWVLATVGIGILMATIDASIVNIALPTILAHFRGGLAIIEWVVLGYLLSIASLLLPFARLADMWGRKKVYTAGFVLFTVGSGLSGGAQSVLQLIAFRVIQGMGAAMLTANGFGIVSAVFPARQRGLALGINGTVVATGITLGPTIGGLLIESLGWRWIFLVNLPIGVIGTAAALLILNERLVSGELLGRRQRFDFAGAVTSSLALIALVVTLNLGPRIGWTSAFILALVGLSIALSAVFLLIESRVEQPLVDLALFRRRAFAAGNLAGLLSFLAISANAFLMPFFLQVVLGFSAIVAGLMITPTALVMAVVAPISGWLSDRVGARILASAGLGVTVAALLLLSSLSASSRYTEVLFWLLLLGLGQGMFQPPNNSSVMGSVPRARLGVASGLLAMMRLVGTVVGVAVSTSFLAGSLSAVQGLGGLSALEMGDISSEAGQDILAAFVAGMRRAYWASAAFAALGAAASWVRGPRRAPPVSLAERMEGSAAADRRERPERRAQG